MAETLASLDADELVAEYQALREVAPRRGDGGYRYFVERTGRPPQTLKESRREEWLAMALANPQAQLALTGETVELLMYALPLYTSGGPKGIRGVDLVGYASETRRFWVVELKAAGTSGYGETPLRALFETLIYGAVVESNMARIADELADQERRVDRLRPGLLIAAPDDYWERWQPNRRIGDWWSVYQAITTAVSEHLDTPLITVSLGQITYLLDIEGRPTVDGVIDCRPVEYSQ